MPGLKSKNCVGACLVAGLLFGSGQVQAGRAFLPNGYGSEALGMAGADVAVARDTNAINTNPAGLTQIRHRAFDAQIQPYISGFKHEDSLGNNELLTDPIGALTAAGFASRFTSHPDWVWGLGMYGQGGTSVGYDNLLTEYGNRDIVSANIGVLKLAGSLAWKVRENLSVGTTLGLFYSFGRQKFFPETSDNSDPTAPFFGLRFDDGSGISGNILVGIQYQPKEQWTVGLVYTSKTDLRLTGGTATLNFESVGLGRVHYDNARLEGFALPQQIDLGVAWRPDARWLVSAEFNWLDYSRALSSSRFRADTPNNPGAPANIDSVTQLRWRDQYVYAFGLAYTLSDKTILRSGFNVENNPVRGETATPPLGLGQERSISIGFGHELESGWHFDAAFEYQLPSTHSYSNPELPLGEKVDNRYALYDFMFSIARRW